MGEPRIAVIGAGVAGLSAAWSLHQRLPRAQIIVLEGADRVGGKLRSAPVGGVRVDVGAESMLARRPEAVQLAEALGLGDAIAHPATTTASVWSRGALRPFPAKTLMGVPSEPGTAAGLLTDEELARASAEPVRSVPVTSADVSVGGFVAARVGDAVVERLVEPLLGGVYAGHARELSLRATVPALWPAAVSGDSLTLTAARTVAAASANRNPVFAGLVGGVTGLVDALEESLAMAGAELRLRTTVRELRRTGPGWRLVTGPVPSPVALDVDGIVLATPAAPAARLLAPHTAAAAELAEMAYASLAIVTLALPLRDLPTLRGSGLLVPPADGKVIKAATFTSQKWAWVASAAPDLMLLRTSIGRHGQVRDLQRDDDDLVATSLGELADALGSALPPPVDRHVQRWGAGLPQYAVGHLDRVQRVRDGVATLPGVAVAGAAYDGVGIPACIASGLRAAGEVATQVQIEAHRAATMGP